MLCLETERLLLRDYRAEDLEVYYRLKSDKKTMYYLQDIQLFSRQQAEEDFAAVLRDMQAGERNFYFLHIETKDTHAQVGCVGYTVTTRTPVGQMVHAGYFSYPSFWGQGYMTEAFSRVLDFAFSEGGVWRLTTGCLAENVGSERVMRKCGLIQEGERPDWEWHDGKLKTRREYRLLRPEWQRRQAARAGDAPR